MLTLGGFPVPFLLFDGFLSLESKSRWLRLDMEHLHQTLIHGRLPLPKPTLSRPSKGGGKGKGKATKRADAIAAIAAMPTFNAETVEWYDFYVTLLVQMTPEEALSLLNVATATSQAGEGPEAWDKWYQLIRRQTPWHKLMAHIMQTTSCRATSAYTLNPKP